MCVCLCVYVSHCSETQGTCKPFPRCATASSGPYISITKASIEYQMHHCMLNINLTQENVAVATTCKTQRACYKCVLICNKHITNLRLSLLCGGVCDLNHDMFILELMMFLSCSAVTHFVRCSGTSKLISLIQV